MIQQIRKSGHGVAPKVACLALAAAFAAQAWADDEDEFVARLTKPESTITLGVGHVSGDNQRFGVYNGLNREGTVGIGAFSLVKRDDASGTWFRAEGRNLGREQAEVRLEHERQGHWRYFVEVDQMTRAAPYDVYSRLQGVGGNSLSYPATAGAQTRATTLLPEFKTERVASRLGLTHLFTPELEIKLLFQNVEKKGERLFGRGTPSVQEFLAEPINSITRQFDLVLNYTGDKLQLSGAYYGSWYLNADNQLNVSGGDTALRTAAGPNLPFSVIALPPDNFAHQFDLTGGYQFTDTTRGNFTLAYTQARQIDSFPAVPAPTAGALPTGGLNRSPPPSTSGPTPWFPATRASTTWAAPPPPFPTSSTTRPPSSSSAATPSTRTPACAWTTSLTTGRTTTGPGTARRPPAPTCTPTAPPSSSAPKTRCTSSASR